MPTGVAPKINKNSKKKNKNLLHLPVNTDVTLTTAGMRNSRDDSISGGAFCMCMCVWEGLREVQR